VNKTMPEGTPKRYIANSRIMPESLTKRDELFGMNSVKIGKQRGNVTVPNALLGAGSWVSGLFSSFLWKVKIFLCMFRCMQTISRHCRKKDLS
jgi:hypothetical protein